MILGLELTDFWGTVNSLPRSARAHIAVRSTKRARSSSASPPAISYPRRTTRTSSAIAEVDLAIAADAEATLPSLIEAVKRLIDRRSQARVPGARSQTGGGQPAPPATARAPTPRTPGTRVPISTARAVARNCGRRSRTKTGRSCRAIAGSAAGRGGSGISTSHYQYIGGPGGVGHRLRRAGRGRRRARQPQARPPLGQHPERRRLDVCAGRPVDGGAPPHPAAHRHAQQPRLSPGGHARAAHGQPPQARHRPRADRQRRSTIPPSTSRSSRRAWASTPKGRSRSEGSRPGPPARDRGGQEAASRRWSTSSRSRAEDAAMKMSRPYWSGALAVAVAVQLLGAPDVAAQNAAQVSPAAPAAENGASGKRLYTPIPGITSATAARLRARRSPARDLARPQRHFRR